MRFRLFVLGLIVAGFVAFLPLLYWILYLSLGFNTMLPWLAAIFYSYLLLPGLGLLLVLLGLRGEGKMTPNSAMGFMVSSLLLGIIVLVIPGLLSGFLGNGPPRGPSFVLLIMGPFLTNLATLIVAFLGSYNRMRMIEIN